jgi:hypothetical protein
MLALDSKMVRMVNGHQYTLTWITVEADRLGCYIDIVYINLQGALGMRICT